MGPSEEEQFLCIMCCGTPSIPTVGQSSERQCNKYSSLGVTTSTAMEITESRHSVNTPGSSSRGVPASHGLTSSRTLLPSLLQLSYYVLLLLTGLLLVPTADAFNVDLESAMVHEGRAGSMFGYAVAQHIDQSTNWLLIGAPRAQTSQPDVVRGGAVFRCKTDRKNSCQEVPFDDTGNNIKYDNLKGTYVPIEDKSNQWFGSTVRSSGENGVIVACAPRYVYFSHGLDKREPVGVCYLAKSSTTAYEKYSPCSKGPLGFNKVGYCQAGFSAALSQDGKRLLIGAPGSWYWQGQIYRFDAVTGQKLAESEEQSADYDYGYKGYATAIGDFNGDGEEDYVVGIPKGDHLLGKVEVYTQNLTVFATIIGEQIGAYFGSSLAVTDLNGDRRDDIIIGAPFYADFRQSDVFDTGRVYIYYQTDNGVFPKLNSDILDGTFSKSRYGMALSSLGDINYDGYGDLCVGAPYAGEDRRGAIYIYHGSKKGIITDASQIIFAKDVETPLTTFGISISGGWDQDNNKYPDMLVGAYESDKAVFLRTRPVVRVHASLKVEPGEVDLSSQACAVPDGTRAPCLSVHTCLEYTGIGLPDELYFDVSWVLDAKDNGSSVQEQRAYFTKSIGLFTLTQKHKLMNKNQWCVTLYSYVKPDPGDKLSPIKIKVDFKLNEEGLRARNRRDLPPILDAYIPTTVSFTAPIQKDCGRDNICIPDLKVQSIRVSAAHIIGSTTALEILISISNTAEDSFNTKLWIDLPPGVQYDTITNQRSVVPVSCGTLEADPKKVVCDLGNPMPKFSESEFTLTLTPTNTNDTKDRMIFTMYANSSNPENAATFENNYASVEIPVTLVADIKLRGKASPELIVLNITEPTSTRGDREVSHVYQLVNQGHSATNQTQLQVWWPSFDKQGNPVLVIEEPLEIEGNGKCDIIILTPKNASNYLRTGNGNLQKLFQERDDRDKRDADEQRIACSDRYCTIIQCSIGYMLPRSDFVLTVRSRLQARNFIQRREATKMYHITSVAFARVLSMPYDFQSVDVSKFEVQRKEIVTKVNTDQLRPASKGVETWVIAVAVTAGLLLLLLLILLLWWCGFFKRKKPEEEGYFVVNGKSDIDNKIVD